MIHPVIHVLNLVVFAVLMSRAGLLQILPSAVLLMAVYIYLGPVARQAAMTMLFRLRWFFLSLLLVYGWLTPDPLSGSITFWGWPSEVGLKTGIKQLCGLALIVMAVNLLLFTMRREQLLQAIYWLAWPLMGVGVSRDRLALRLVLVLDQVAGVRERAGQVLSDQAPTSRRSLSRIAAVATTIFQKTLEQAEAKAEEVIVFQPLAAPAWYQWGLPLVLVPSLFIWI